MQKTQGEIEAAICDCLSRFEQEYMGRGPKEIHAHLFGDCLVVRLQGVLTAAEKQLVKTLAAEKGQGSAQAGTDAPDRNGAAGDGEDGRGNHRRQSGQPAPRHQHDHG